MDRNIKTVLKRLNDKGHEAYIVGGAVRDLLLNKVPEDYDICTSARPWQVQEIFHDHDMYLSGIRHGTVSVIFNNKPVEITTFRKDGIYKDKRHPDDVFYTDDVKDDLMRRDFTVNTFLMDKDEKIYDLLMAEDDLKEKVIRTVGDPYKRFDEDALRILRAIRFKAELDFKIEEKTDKMIHILKDALKSISKERIATEFIKTVKAPHPETLAEYADVYHDLINYKYSDKIRKTDDLLIRLALLFKEDQSGIKKLFLNKRDTKIISDLIRYSHPEDDDLTRIFSNVDIKRYISFMKIDRDIDLNDRYERLKDYIVTIDDLAIDSSELMALGYQGKEIGDIKKELVNKILDQEFRNDHVSIMTYLKEVL